MNLRTLRALGLGRETSMAMVAGAVAFMLAAGFGCAGSTASRAMRDRSRDLSLATIDKSAETLATDILTAPEFEEWRSRYLRDHPDAARHGIRMILVEFVNKTPDPQWSRKMEEFCYDLTRHLKKGKVHLVYRSSDEELGGIDPSKRPMYVEALEDFNRMDQSLYYNQDSGRQSMGGFEKPVLGLYLRVMKAELGDLTEFTMRAILIDGRTKEEVVSVRSAPPTG
jgi:hypothetical protein